MPELSIDMTCNVDISPDFIEPERLKALKQRQDTAYELCEQVKDNMVMHIQMTSDGSIDKLDQVSLVVDKDVEKMSDLIA